jgi:hypothetical protein
MQPMLVRQGFPSDTIRIEVIHAWHKRDSRCRIGEQCGVALVDDANAPLKPVAVPTIPAPDDLRISKAESKDMNIASHLYLLSIHEMVLRKSSLDQKRPAI